MTSTNALCSLRVTRKQAIADGIFLFELRDPGERTLPPFVAGAHVSIQLPNGAMRQYSLCSSPLELGSYQLAVKRDPTGRGGSISLVDDVQEGSLLPVGAPANLFSLSDKAKSFIFIAGGIGITPMMAMMKQVQADGLRSFKLYYFTPNAQSTAFAQELHEGPMASQVIIHHSRTPGAKRYDLWKIFEKCIAGTHVYCCGPQGLMDEVRDMTGHWPATAIHFENFGVDTKPKLDDKPFEVALRSSGQSFEIPVGRSIFDVLKSAGIHVPSSCESGTCGSCKVDLLEGDADHRDLVLMDEEKSNKIMICVSRAKSERLMLGL